MLFADILGFKNIVRACEHSHLRVIYRHAVQAAALAAVFGGRGRPGERGPAVNVRLISDSLLLWTDDDDLEDLLCLLVASRSLLNTSLCGGLPMRAALTWGQVEHWTDDSGDGRFGVESVFGLALVEAYEAADDQEWAGGIVLPAAISRFEELVRSRQVMSSREPELMTFDTLVERTGLVMRYPVPMKGGDRDAYTIDWLRATSPTVRPPEIRHAFERFHPRPGGISPEEARAVETKLQNTSRFVSYASSRAESVDHDSLLDIDAAVEQLR